MLFPVSVVKRASGVQSATSGRVSERASGWEAGGGLAIVITRKIALNPGLRYAKMEPVFNSHGKLRMRYLVADLGILVGF